MQHTTAVARPNRVGFIAAALAAAAAPSVALANSPPYVNRPHVDLRAVLAAAARRRDGIVRVDVRHLDPAILFESPPQIEAFGGRVFDEGARHAVTDRAAIGRLLDLALDSRPRETDAIADLRWNVRFLDRAGARVLDVYHNDDAAVGFVATDAVTFGNDLLLRYLRATFPDPASRTR